MNESVSSTYLPQHKSVRVSIHFIFIQCFLLVLLTFYSTYRSIVVKCCKKKFYAHTGFKKSEGTLVGIKGSRVRVDTVLSIPTLRTLHPLSYNMWRLRKLYHLHFKSMTISC